MSFRRRNVALNSFGTKSNEPTTNESNTASLSPGVRPSPLDGRPTTSTGTQSLDSFLGGHSGLPLGNSIMIEEDGTTDFAGALLKFYAAQGIVQGHQIHVVGVGEQWVRELPGIAGTASTKSERGNVSSNSGQQEKMKIAWRYERLGEFGAVSGSSRGGLALGFVFPHTMLQKSLRQISKALSKALYFMIFLSAFR